MNVWSGTGFLGLSGLLHVAVWLGAAPDVGIPTEDQAATTIALSSNAEIADLVADWTRAPAVDTAAAAPTPPALPTLVGSVASLDVPSPPVAPDVLSAPDVPDGPASAPTDPRPPVPQVQSATSLPALADPVTAAPVLPVPQDAASRSVQPNRLATPDLLGGTPQIDTVPGGPSAAPTRSVRPEARPARRAAPTPPQTTASPAPSVAPAAAPSVTAPAQAAPARASAPDPGLIREWGGGIRNRIERAKRYPRGTRAAGTVRLSLSVNASGQLTALGVSASSGDANLDQAALAAVQRARLPRAPAGLPARSYSFTIALTFAP